MVGNMLKLKKMGRFDDKNSGKKNEFFSLKKRSDSVNIKIGFNNFVKENAEEAILIGAVNNTVKENAEGVVMIAQGNMVWENSNGLMIGGPNVVMKDMKGVAVGEFNVFGNLKGLSIGCCLTMVREVISGVACSLVNVSKRFEGVMVGLVNIVKEGSRGVQIGLINVRLDAPKYARYIPVIAIRWSDKKGEK